MSSVEDSGPQPTAHEVVPGCSLDRRTFLQGTAAAAAIATGGAATSSTAAADEDDPTTGAYYDQSFEDQDPLVDTSTFLFGRVTSLWSSNNEDPNADRIALYSQCNSAKAWWDRIYTTKLDNRLTDLQMAAHVESRSRIADAWEAGENASTAYNYVFDGVEDVYSVPFANTVETAATVWAEVAYVSRVARESEDIPDRFVATTIANDRYSAHQDHDDGDEDTDVVEDETYIDPEPVDTSVTLPNGDVHETTVPMIHQEWDNGDGLTYYLTDELLNAYDPNEDLFTGFPTRDGNEVDIRGDIMSMAGNDAEEDDDMPAQSITVLTEVGEILHDIEQEMDEVKANYDLSLVEDIYDLLDSGEIEPSDVRGVSGMAEHLSGTTDATENHYQMALMAQLGLDRSDFADVSSMTLEYTGKTSREIVRDDSGDIEGLEYDDEEEGLEIKGQLFADLTHSDGFANDATYYCSDSRAVYADGNVIVVGQYTNPGTFHEIDANGIIQSIDVTPDLEHAAVITDEDNDARIRLFDLESGDEEWSTSRPHARYVAVDPQKEYVVASSNNATEDPIFRLHEFDGGSSAETFDEDGEASGPLNWSNDGDYIGFNGYVQEAGTDEYEISAGVVTRDLDSVWRGSGTSEEVYLSNTDDLAAIVDGGVEVRDLSAGEQLWSNSNYSGPVAFTPEDEHLICLRDGEIAYLEAQTGDELWRHNPTDNVNELLALGNSVLATTSGDTLIVSDGGDSVDSYSVNLDEIHIMENYSEYDGILRNAMAYHGPSGDTYNLLNGTVDVIELTDRDGEALPDDWEGDWDRPQHDTIDTSEYRDELIRISETHAEAVAADEEDDSDSEISVGLSNPFGDFGEGAGLLGLGLIGIVVLAVIGIVTDVIPGLGN